jgi:hypothetical protein
MKKPDKSQTGESKAQKPLPTHKELVGQITEENRAYFEKKDATTRSKMEKEKYPPALLPNSLVPRAFHRTTCRHCSVHVEYPNEAEGQTAPCPKCGNNIFLIEKARGGVKRTTMREIGGSASPAYNRRPGAPPFGAKGEERTAMREIGGSVPSPAYYRSPDAPPFSAKVKAACNQTKFKLGFIGWIVVVGILFFGSGIFLNTFFPLNDAKLGAYEAAKDFATRAYPGAKSFSSIDTSPVSENNGIYTVRLLVDGVNAFNAPIRNVVVVQESLHGNNWQMLSIDQEWNGVE